MGKTGIPYKAVNMVVVVSLFAREKIITRAEFDCQVKLPSCQIRKVESTLILSSTESENQRETGWRENGKMHEKIAHKNQISVSKLEHQL